MCIVNAYIHDYFKRFYLSDRFLQFLPLTDLQGYSIGLKEDYVDVVFKVEFSLRINWSPWPRHSYRLSSIIEQFYVIAVYYNFHSAIEKMSVNCFIIWLCNAHVENDTLILFIDVFNINFYFTQIFCNIFHKWFISFWRKPFVV